MILVPIVAVFIVFVTLFVAFQARSVIISRAKSELHQESRANAAEIAGSINGFKEFFNSVASTLESVAFKDNDEIVDKFQYTMNRFEETPTGLYIGLDDKDYIDISHWVPDEGYDPTERGWYQAGIRNEMTNLLKQSENAINKTNAVSEIGDNVNEVLGNTVNQINDLIDEVGVTVDGVNTISALTQECDASKVVIVDAMSSLSAISEENAASTEETSASMEELNATVNVLASSADNLHGIAKKLDTDLEFFKL